MATLDDLNYQPEMVSPWKTGSKWGAIGAGAVAAIGLIMFLVGATQSQISTWLSIAIIIGVIRQAIIEHRDQELNRRITFLRAFRVGRISTLVFALLSAVWVFVFFSLIAPGLIDEIKETAFNEMLKDGNMEASKAEEMMDSLGFFFSPTFFMIASFFYHWIPGVIISVIAAAVLNKNT